VRGTIKRFYDMLGLQQPAMVIGDAFEPPYMPDIYLYGREGTYEELVDLFGQVVWDTVGLVHPDATHIFRVAQLHLEKAATDGCDQVVEVIDKDGVPVTDIPVVRSWAWPSYDAESCPALVDWTGEYPQTARWTGFGVLAVTNLMGRCWFNMGRGDAFFPDQTGGGFSCVYPAHYSGPGDVVHRLGWLDGTPYHALRIVYRMVPVEDDNGGGEEPESGNAIFKVTGISLSGELVVED